MFCIHSQQDLKKSVTTEVLLSLTSKQHQVDAQKSWDKVDVSVTALLPVYGAFGFCLQVHGLLIQI